MLGDVSADPSFEREKWAVDVRLRERELAVLEREVAVKENEQGLKAREQARSRWANPLVIAVFAAALAALGNAGVAWINGWEERRLEDTRNKAQLALEREKATTENQLEKSKTDGLQAIEETKAEAARILEVIKTSDPDTAAVNLSFLLETGLIANESRRKSLSAFLAKRTAGEGPSLPNDTQRCFFSIVEDNVCASGLRKVISCGEEQRPMTCVSRTASQPNQ